MFSRIGFLLLTLLAASSFAAIERVHVIQTCHLDVGFALLAAGELDNYHKYLLEAAAIANDFRQNPGKHGEGLKFLTHSYVVSLLMDCPLGMNFTCFSAEERETVRKAFQQGDLYLQAFPFNAETDMFTTDFFEQGLALSKFWAANLSIPAPKTMTQRDVPGATVAMLPLLAKHGVKAFSSGVNTASLPPSVPRAFVWKDQVSEAEILTTVHPHGYGGIDRIDCVIVEELNMAMCPDYKGDNQGPWSRSEIEQHWQQLMLEFPSASIFPSTFDAFFSELEQVKDKLPVVTDEIGDTWIYGVASDPIKVQRYRLMLQAMADCPHAMSHCDMADARVANFTRLLLKNPEHTWGGDVKTYLHDEGNWANGQFHSLQYSAENYKFITQTWQEQRNWGVNFPLQALGDHPLASLIQSYFDQVKPAKPDTSKLKPLDPKTRFKIGNTTFGFNATTGAMNFLENDRQIVIANSGHEMFGLEYKVHSAAEYDNFFDQYAQRIDGKIPDYFPKDFGKPGLYNNPLIAKSLSNHGQLINIYSDLTSTIITHIKFPSDLCNTYGAPDEVYVTYTVSGDRGLTADVQIFDKTATRLPESMWVTFHPSSGSDWKMEKMGRVIEPINVVTNGSRHLDALFSPLTQTSSPLTVQSLHTALVSFGDTNPFPTPSGNWYPTLSNGVNYCLFDNIWGTNYVMWFPFKPEEKDVKFRFTISY